MKIYNDVLARLKVRSVYVIHENEYAAALPLEIRGNVWQVTASKDNLSGRCRLKVRWNEETLYLDALIRRQAEKDTASYGTYEIEVLEGNEEKEKEFLMLLREMEIITGVREKRKEERYEIGTDERKCRLIEFSSPEQKIVAGKKQLSCIILNVSYSGARIVSEEGDFRSGNRACLFLSFVNPIEQIPIVCSIKNCLLKSISESKNVSIISVEFIDAPLCYKERLDSYIEKTRSSL